MKRPDMPVHSQVSTASSEQGQGLCASGVLVTPEQLLRQVGRFRPDNAVQTLSAQCLGSASLGGMHLSITSER